MPRRRYSILSNVFCVSHTSQDAEESGEDFAEDINNVPAEEDEPPEVDSKKRKVCLAVFDKAVKCASSRIGDQRPASKAATTSTKPASKKAKPASGRAKKVKPTAEGDEED